MRLRRATALVDGKGTETMLSGVGVCLGHNTCGSVADFQVQPFLGQAGYSETD